MVKRAILVCVLAAAWPAFLDAGALFGSIFYNGAALKGASIVITCGGATATGSTLDDGSYRIAAPEGQCRFTVSNPAFGSASADVVSSSSSTRYSFDVVKGASGHELRRR